MTSFTHLDDDGRARMVDVGRKDPTARRAVAGAVVRLGQIAFAALRDSTLAKGDALAVARLAGIQAAKRTADWIPLCHSIPLDHIAVDFELDEQNHAVHITAVAAARWTTGVEMEALVAASAAGLALYDMAKALDRGISLERVRLLEKTGGRSGSWKAAE